MQPFPNFLFLYRYSTFNTKTLTTHRTKANFTKELQWPIQTALIAAATIFALLYIKKLQEPNVIAVAAVLGIFIKLII